MNSVFFDFSLPYIACIFRLLKVEPNQNFFEKLYSYVIYTIHTHCDHADSFSSSSLKSGNFNNFLLVLFSIHEVMLNHCTITLIIPSGPQLT